MHALLILMVCAMVALHAVIGVAMLSLTTAVERGLSWRGPAVVLFIGIVAFMVSCVVCVQLGVI